MAVQGREENEEGSKGKGEEEEAEGGKEGGGREGERGKRESKEEEDGGGCEANESEAGGDGEEGGGAILTVYTIDRKREGWIGNELVKLKFVMPSELSPTTVYTHR